jgi:hypothetical protein
MYTAQVNAHGNVIVCKGDDVRNSYQIALYGTYQECLDFKNAEKHQTAIDNSWYGVGA